MPEFFGAAGLGVLVSSRSYMPAYDSPAGLAAGARAREIFDRFAVDGRVAVRYRTVAIIGAPGAAPGAGR